MWGRDGHVMQPAGPREGPLHAQLAAAASLSSSPNSFRLECVAGQLPLSAPRRFDQCARCGRPLPTLMPPCSASRPLLLPILTTCTSHHHGPCRPATRHPRLSLQSHCLPPFPFVPVQFP